MTVKELKESLAKYDESLQVYCIALDTEENSQSFELEYLVPGIDISNEESNRLYVYSSQVRD